MPVLEIALSLTLLAMTENPLKTVIASDRRERDNHVFRIVTQPRKPESRTIATSSCIPACPKRSHRAQI